MEILYIYFTSRINVNTGRWWVMGDGWSVVVVICCWLIVSGRGSVSTSDWSVGTRWPSDQSDVIYCGFVATLFPEFPYFCEGSVYIFLSLFLFSSKGSDLVSTEAISLRTLV